MVSQTCSFAFLALIFTSVLSLDIRCPPSITVGPVLHNIFRPDDVIQLDCHATGTPSPVYYWMRNGLPVHENDERIQRLREDEGTIKIINASPLDEGSYQCFAENQYGTAISAPSIQQRAILPTDGEKTVRTVLVVEGEPFSVERIKARCFPKPSFEWFVAMQLDSNPVKVTTSRRIQVNGDTGDLHFAYATPEDQQSADKVYKCIVINPHLDLSAGGSYSNVTVYRDPNGVQPFPPRIGFITQSPFTVLEGQNVSLRCFYYGNPAPEINWSRRNGQMPLDRFQKNNFNAELFIKNVKQEDEGEYVCQGTNSRGTNNTKIQLIVEAAPVFRQSSDLPRNLNLTDGDSVSLQCLAHAEPTADIVWLRNGKPLDPDHLPDKFHLSSNKQNLTIRNVCKNCGNDTSDLQVIQCNSSNIHGQAFAAGYINVLLRTQLVDASDFEDRVSHDEDKQFHFQCVPEADDSTPVLLRWFHTPISDTLQDDDTTQEVRNDIRFVNSSTALHKRWIGPDGSLTLRLGANDTEGWAVYGGRYKCVATNGYSSAERKFVIRVDNLPAPEPGSILISCDIYAVTLL